MYPFCGHIAMLEYTLAMSEIYMFATDIRRDKITLAKPIAVLPKTWLKVYNA